ncbi:AEC family transporter [Photobacterium kasasachensis]|uniref:AEC family transporter n=1 Tax=Photobacterium kasasachensis TaxID=2910240 RepID=UPI003D118228
MFEKVIGILFPVFAIVLIGYVISRHLKPDFKPINRINMDVFVPALIFSSLVTMKPDTTQVTLLAAATCAVLLPGLLMFALCRFRKITFKAWGPPQMFRNSGNLAIPLFSYTFGDTAIGSAVLLFVVSTTLHITVGMALLSKKGPLSLQQLLKTPLLLATLAALAFNLLEIPVWRPVYEATQLLGQASIPVMLLSLGAQMVNLRMAGLRIGLMTTLFSLGTGAITFAVIYLFIPLPHQQLQMMVLFTMLPPAVMNYLFAERFNVEPTNVASMVLFGNFFAVVTLPVLLWGALAL